MKRIINAETILQNGAPVSAGSGVEYVNTASPIVSTPVSTTDTWTDVTNATVTVTPTEANEKWEIKFEGSLYMGSDDGSNISANVRIVDNSNNLIDDALMFVAVRHYSAGSGAGFPVALVARDTISAPKTYKVQIRMSGNGSDIGIYNGNITGDLSGDDSKAKFWAEKKTLGDNGGGGSALTVQDEGSNLSTAVTKINFVGNSVVATQPAANEILVTVPGQPSYVAHAYQTGDISQGSGEQNLQYSNKVDPGSIMSISGGLTKFTVPANALGIVRVKTKLAPQSSWNGTFFFTLPVIRRTSDNVYMGSGDRIKGTWVSGENNNGFHFPSGEAFFNLAPGVEYTVKSYCDAALTLTGGTNGNGDVNYTVVEIW